MQQQQTQNSEKIPCPLCGQETIRIQRKGYMRLVPSSRHIYCEECNLRFLKVFGLYKKLGPAYIVKKP